jgi:hypothetical protein
MIFRWQRGRQGTGYDKMLLATARWPLPFDCYLLRYPDGSEIPVHTDPVPRGRHFRLNIILKTAKAGGEFISFDRPIFATKRIVLFRPDISPHFVRKVEGGSRYVFSLGWVLR